MKFGVTIFPTDYSISPADLATALEVRGFESLWLPEHSHIPASRKSPWPGGGDLPKPYYDCFDPLVSLAAAAAVTMNLKLCTGICLVVQRDPIQLAKEISTLDQISGGRVIMGVGGGFPHGARRAIEYGDGWMPIGGRSLDILDVLPRFRQMAAEADRDPGSPPVTVFGVAPDGDEIERHADAGVDRGIFLLPSASRDDVLPRLDRLAGLIG